MDIPVLMYHRVRGADESARSDFVVSEGVLRRQLEYLHERRYRTPSVAEALAAGDDGDVKRVLLTFDDGYLDNFAHALPLLRTYGFRATIFVVSGGCARRNFWDVAPSTAGAPLMDAAQLRECVRAGLEIGAHSVSHARLTTLSTPCCRRELQDSKAALEDLLGTAVDLFAYPFGDVDERVKALTREAGYRAAFAVNSGPLDFHADPYEIRRVLITDRADPAYLFAKTSGLEKAARVSASFWRTLLGDALGMRAS